MLPVYYWYFYVLTDLARWRKCQALLKFKRQERKTLAEAEEEEFSDEVKAEEAGDSLESHLFATYSIFL